jgi:hypothetical protein
MTTSDWLRKEKQEIYDRYRKAREDLDKAEELELAVINRILLMLEEQEDDNDS